MVVLKILAFIILILGVGFFTSSETAFLSLSKLKVRHMQEEGKKGANVVAKLKANTDRLLTTVLIGTNILNSLTSALATAMAISLLGKNSIDFVPFIVAFFITTFGQIIPKTAAGLHPEKFARMWAVPIRFLEILLFPIVWLFERLSHVVVKIVEKIIKPSGAIITEEELKTLIDLGEHEGTIEKNESYMLNKLIKFNDLEVNDVMLHRSRVSMISIEATRQEVVEEFLRSGFSTVTVYAEDKENVVGIINYKTILFATEDDDTTAGFAERNMTEVLYVPGTWSVLELLNKFRKTHNRFAVVLNEQGQTSGIITMEDIMRVVFGRMTDENTLDELQPEDKIQLISLNTFLVPGDMKLDEVNQILGTQLESENMTTLGGWLLEKIGYLPTPGSVFINNRSVYTAEEVKGRRINLVRIKL